MGRLQAGMARHTISPPLGTPLFGYIGREHGATRVHDNLMATALVLSDGETQLALVVCDLLMLHPTTVTAIRAGVTDQTGIPASHVMLCCSHTHSGPVTFQTTTESVAAGGISDYLDQLVRIVVSAVTLAHEELQPAWWGIGRGKATIGVNRRQQLADGRTIIGRNEAGPTDPDLLVLRIDRLEGGRRIPLSLLVNYACHAVCLGPESEVVSADWPGVMRRDIEGRMGGAVAFLQGACADVNPLAGPQASFDGADRLGTEIAGQVIALYEQIRLTDRISLHAAHRDIRLPLLGPVGRDGRQVRSLANLAAEALDLAEGAALARLDERFPWHADVDKVDGVWTVRTELQTLLLSDVAIVGIAAEPFVEIGLRIKARSPAAVTLVAGYANGCVGYVPVPLAYEQGGYEVTESHLYYRLPAPLGPACAELVIGGALTLVEMLTMLNEEG